MQWQILSKIALHYLQTNSKFSIVQIILQQGSYSSINWYGPGFVESAISSDIMDDHLLVIYN